MKTHRTLDVAFFGSSLVSAYWNGAATYYRGILRALARRGHRIRFFEPDAYDRQQHRDIPDPPWATVVVYGGNDLSAAENAVAQASDADLVVKASGVGVFDAYLEQAVLSLRRPDNQIAFWDVDAPATLERIERDPADPFRALIPQFDLIFTYGGGTPVTSAYDRHRARRCVPIYNGLDPDVHHPAQPDARFAGDLGFLGNRLPDREARVDEFFLAAAEQRPDLTFVLGGSGWETKRLPSNVRYVGHVYTRDHNAFNSSTRAVLNVNRDGMARFGFSPATRVFEAAGAGACIITDAFVGVETFLEPGTEILIARSGHDVAAALGNLDTGRARAIGSAARARVIAEHTYDQRALAVERALGLSGQADPTIDELAMRRARAASAGADAGTGGAA